MGVVFQAQDIALNRPVAVKLLLPEHATAELATRFLREAQVLARLRHPNIVTVHQVCEKAGLFYYIMEWLEGETLQGRLTRGHLSRPEVVRVGAELLDALGAAHKQRWIHRDVKPGNIFLTEERAILTDFGIARPISDDTTSLTDTRQLIGTLAYMSPEQREGGHVTEATDIYSTGLVLYEAMSGRRWWQRDHESHDWSGIPSRLRAVVRKAMELNPSDRWRNAALFRNELLKTLKSRSQAVLLAAGVILLCVAAVYPYLASRREPPNGRIVRIQVLESRGAGGWSDSIGTAVATRLAGFPDLIVSGPLESRSNELEGPELVLTGSVEFSGDSLQATIQARPCPAREIRVTRKETVANWRTLADSLVAQLLYAIYRCDANADPSLPRDALPRTSEGWRAWSQAEPLFTRARWGEAAIAYRRAEAIDTTCLLCSFRINDIDRWLDQPHDPARLSRLQAHLADFPPHYRLLIQAAAASGETRIALMDTAVLTRDFFLGFFHRGDEIFHRGPVFGRHRGEAIGDLEQTVRLRPDFAPGWEHLAWLRIAEGDSAGAGRALDSLKADRRRGRSDVRRAALPSHGGICLPV